MLKESLKYQVIIIIDYYLFSKTETHGAKKTTKRKNYAMIICVPHHFPHPPKKSFFLLQIVSEKKLNQMAVKTAENTKGKT